jgi:glutathione S-transferase
LHGLDQRLGEGRWPLVGRCSIVDIHLFRLFWHFRGSPGADPAGFPNLSAHYERIMKRPAVRQTLEAEAALGRSLPA